MIGIITNLLLKHKLVTAIAMLITILIIFVFGTAFFISGSFFIKDVQEATPVIANDIKEASDMFDAPHQMNSSIKNIESVKIIKSIDFFGFFTIPLWYVGYNVSADAFNAGSSGLLTVSCDAFNKKNGEFVAQESQSFHAGRNLLTPFTCEFKKVDLPKGEYDFNVSVAEEEIYS